MLSQLGRSGTGGATKSSVNSKLDFRLDWALPRLSTYYEVEAIPERWRAKLARLDTLERCARAPEEERAS